MSFETLNWRKFILPLRVGWRVQVHRLEYDTATNTINVEYSGKPYDYIFFISALLKRLKLVRIYMEETNGYIVWLSRVSEGPQERIMEELATTYSIALNKNRN